MSTVDLSQTDFFQKTQSILELHINDTVDRKLSEFKTQLILSLSEDELKSIDLSDVISSCYYPVHINLCLNNIRKHRVKKSISEDDRCMARIGLGTQCTRSHNENSEYCKSHNVSLPYGRIDGPVEGKSIKIIKKRGRRTHSDKVYTLDDLDLDKYVQATITCINNIVLIQDEFGVLYNNDNTNQIIGIVTDEGVTWY